MTLQPPSGSSILATLALVGMLATAAESAAHARHTAPLSMLDIQSFDYFIAPGVDGAPGGGHEFQAAAAEDYDMLIADYYTGHETVDPASIVEFQDSTPRGRLAIAYIDAGEFMRCCSNIDRPAQDRWFDAAGELTGAAPSWFGPRNPKFKGLWAVREWDSRWQTYILSEIDTIIALGFDGVFLDVLYSDGVWGPKGSAAGQAGVADYRNRQMQFSRAIWDHVRNDLKKPQFVIIANYSGVAQDNIPALTDGLNYADAIMKESEYFARDDRPAPWVAGRPMEQYFAVRNAKFFAGILRREKVVLLQDYDLSFDHLALMIKECARYGYLASNSHFPQNLIHIDGLPVCSKKACTANTSTGGRVSFERSASVP